MSKRRWKPVGPSGRVFVKRDPDVAEVNGIVVPSQWKKHAQLGTVVRAHDGVEVVDDNGVHRLRDCEVRPGDRVVFGLYSGSDITLDGEALTVMAEEEIMAVLE